MLAEKQGYYAYMNQTLLKKNEITRVGFKRQKKEEEAGRLLRSSNFPD